MPMICRIRNRIPVSLDKLSVKYHSKVMQEQEFPASRLGIPALFFGITLLDSDSSLRKILLRTKENYQKLPHDKDAHDPKR